MENNINETKLIKSEEIIKDISLNLKSIEYADIENSLLRSFYNLSLAAQRLLIQDIGSRNQETSTIQYEDGNTYYGSKYLINNFFKNWKIIDGGKQRSVLINAGKELSSVKIGYKEPNLNKIKYINIYQLVEVDLNTGEITTIYSNIFYNQFLKNFKNGYTRLLLEESANIKDEKSLHWYTYLMSYQYFQGKGTNEINSYYQILTFEEIRNIFQIEGYPNSKDFRKRIIDEPLQRLNKTQNNIKISWEYLKNKTANKIKYNTVKIKIELIETWNFKNIDFVLKIIEPDITEDIKNIIIDYKERYLDLLKINYKYKTLKIDFENLSENENLLKIKNFFIETLNQLLFSLKEDNEFKKKFKI